MINDAHSDIFSFYYYEKIKQNLDLYYEKTYHSTIGVIFLKEKDQMFSKFYDQFYLALKLLKKSKKFHLVKKYQDFKSNKLNIILGSENIKALENNLCHLRYFYKKGLRHVILTWNYNNMLAGGSKDNGRLTKKGIKYLKYIESKNIILDLSHLNYESFYDCLNHYHKPFICSHSNCYNLCPHPRNLKDDQIKMIKKNKGLIGICSIKDFISYDISKQNIKGLVDHIDYLKNLIGIDYICLGMDYMGFNKIDNDNLFDLAYYKDTIKIKEELYLRG